MIFETHAHYDDKKFDIDRAELLLSMKEQGIGYITNIGADMEGSRASIALAEEYDFVYAAIGVHPSEVYDLTEADMQWLKENSSHEKVVAIGEIGLDYNWDDTPEGKVAQKKWFIRQMEIAREVGLPIVVHSRDAAEDTLRIMQENHAEEIPGVVHCFSYSKEMAKIYVDMGYYIGVGGVVTFKNGRKLVETVEEIPLEKILLETDCPYLSPEPHRGERNSSLNLPFVAAKIAEIKNVSVDEVIKVTEENAFNLYRKAR